MAGNTPKVGDLIEAPTKTKKMVQAMVGETSKATTNDGKRLIFQCPSCKSNDVIDPKNLGTAFFHPPCKTFIVIPS